MAPPRTFKLFTVCTLVWSALVWLRGRYWTGTDWRKDGVLEREKGRHWWRVVVGV